MRFRSGDFLEIARKRRVQVPNEGHLISPSPSPSSEHRPLGDKTHPPRGPGDKSVGAQGECQLSVGRWDLGKQAASPGASPQIGPLVPRRRPRRRLTDEDAGAGHPGERRGAYVGGALCVVKVNT